MTALRVVEDLATALAYELLGKWGLDDWTIAWHDDGVMAGRCIFACRVITLNRRILLDTAARNIVETILHEIAHALVRPNDSHDQVWYEKLIAIGGTGVWVFNDGKARSVVVDRPSEQ